MLPQITQVCQAPWNNTGTTSPFAIEAQFLAHVRRSLAPPVGCGLKGHTDREAFRAFLQVPRGGKPTGETALCSPRGARRGRRAPTSDTARHREQAQSQRRGWGDRCAGGEGHRAQASAVGLRSRSGPSATARRASPWRCRRRAPQAALPTHRASSRPCGPSPPGLAARGDRGIGQRAVCPGGPWACRLPPTRAADSSPPSRGRAHPVNR